MSGWALLGLLAVLFVAWHFLPDAKPPRPSPKFRRNIRVDARDPRWREFIEEHCGSPAEIAFLTAMIDAHEFRPELGSLQAEGLKLDLQVQEGPYRVDFLVNEWFVIEIDRAAYHSSDEAKARDRQRDDYFEGLGYSVLRIPAKVVFNDPDEAVRRVGSALAAGKRVIVAPVQPSGFERLGKTVSGLGRAMEEMNDDISRRHKIDAALSRSRSAIDNEKRIIDSAVVDAMSQVNIKDYIGSSEERRKSFDNFYSELEAAYERYDSERNTSSSKETVPVAEVARSLPPSYDGDPETDTLIMATYLRMERDRENYLADVRGKIGADSRLGPLVQSLLNKSGYSGLWASISRNKGDFEAWSSRAAFLHFLAVAEIQFIVSSRASAAA